MKTTGKRRKPKNLFSSLNTPIILLQVDEETVSKNNEKGYINQDLHIINFYHLDLQGRQSYKVLVVKLSIA